MIHGSDEHLAASRCIYPDPNGVDCYHEEGQVLETAVTGNPDRVTQTSINKPQKSIVHLQQSMPKTPQQ